LLLPPIAPAIPTARFDAPATFRGTDGFFSFGGRWSLVMRSSRTFVR